MIAHPPVNRFFSFWGSPGMLKEQLFKVKNKQELLHEAKSPDWHH
jgi:hypothetical protein